MAAGRNYRKTADSTTKHQPRSPQVDPLAALRYEYASDGLKFDRISQSAIRIRSSTDGGQYAEKNRVELEIIVRSLSCVGGGVFAERSVWKRARSW